MKKIIVIIVFLLILGSVSFANENPQSEGPWFTFNYAIGWGMGSPGTEKPGGVEFSVWIDAGKGFQKVYVSNYNKLFWYPDAINLAPYAGKKIKIRLQTKHIENRIHMDYPYFGNPCIQVGTIDNLKEVKNLALEKPIEYGGINSNGEYIKMEEEDSVFGGASVLSKINSKEKIAIFSGDKYITVPGKSMSGLFMGINMGQEYMNVGAGPLGEAYIGPMPPAVYADWSVDVPNIDDKIDRENLQINSQENNENKLNFKPSKDLIILSSQSNIYQYKEGFFANFENNVFSAKTSGGIGYAFAGIEISNTDKLRFKIESNSLKPIDDNSFGGLVVDYHSKNGYLHRVWLGLMGSGKGYDKRVCPWIYDESSMSLVQRVAFSEEFVDISKDVNNNIMEFSFAKYAPSDWDGRAYVACGLQNCEGEADIFAEILDKKSYIANSTISGINDVKGKFIKLEKDNIILAVSKNNGAICGLWHNGERILNECADKYTLYRKESTINISETFDKVKKTEKKNSSLIVTCENIVAPELLIIKEYSFTDTGELKKKVSFDTKDTAGFFICLESGAEINSDFRNVSTGYGSLASRKVVSQGKVVELTDDVASEQAGNGLAPVLIKNDLSFGFGAFRYKVNDRFVMRAGTKKTQKGFYTKIFTDFLKPENPVSGEIVYKFFSGNLSVFDKYYMNLPEYKELFTFDSPEWIKRVVCDAMYLSNGQEEFMKQASPLLVTETIWFYNSPWGNWGGYHENPDVMFPGTHQVAPGQRNSFPNTRLAKYNNFTFDTSSDTYKNHKDWGVRDRDGELVSTGIASDSNKGPSFYPQILNPEVKKGLLEMHADQIRKWKLDYFYTDGPGYGQEEIDWGIMDVTQNYDWLEYLKDLYKSIRDVNPEAIIFSNGLMPYSSFSYIEYRDPQWQQQMTDEWKQIATELYQCKYEEPVGNTKVPTYGNITADPALSSYMIMYGWVGNLYDKYRYPFMEAAWEYRGLSLLEDALSPNWLNEDTYFEACAFDKEGNTVVNIFNHDENKDKVKLTLDVSKTNLRVGEPLNIYYMCMNNTPKTITDKDGVLKIDPESVVTKAFGEPVIISWGDLCKDKIEFEVPVKKGLITSVIFTHSPALIKSVDNRDTHTYFPAQLDAQCINSDYKTDSVSFDVNTTGDCEIILPGFGISDDINTSYSYSQIIWSDMKALKLNVPKGKHSFAFAYNSTPALKEICNLDFEDNERHLNDFHCPEGVLYEITDSEKGKSLKITGNNIWSYAREPFLIDSKGTRYLSLEFDFKVLDSENGIPPFINFELKGKDLNECSMNFTFDDKTIYYNKLRLADYDRNFNHVKTVIDNLTGKISVFYNSEMWGRYDVSTWEKPEIQTKRDSFIQWTQVMPFLGAVNGGGSGSILYDNIKVISYD